MVFGQFSLRLGINAFVNCYDSFFIIVVQLIPPYYPRFIFLNEKKLPAFIYNLAS